MGVLLTRVEGKKDENSGGERLNVDYRIGLRDQLGRLRDEKLSLIPALP